MKYILCVFLCTVTAALATNVGDTYQQVIAEKGKPKSEIDAGSLQILKYPDATIEIRSNLVSGIKPVVAPPPDSNPPVNNPIPAPSFAPTSPKDQVAALKKERVNAILRVQRIVNQPVTSQSISTGMNVTMFTPGWFHGETLVPDFTADVRKTQKLNYVSFEYVTSDLNPGTAFTGSELEYNPMLKAFYTDLTVPKKKLSESEMLEINRLFRIIGQCEEQLNKMLAPKK